MAGIWRVESRTFSQIWGSPIFFEWHPGVKHVYVVLPKPGFSELKHAVKIADEVSTQREAAIAVAAFAQGYKAAVDRQAEDAKASRN